MSANLSPRCPRRHRLTPLVAALAALLPLSCLAAKPVVPPPPNAVPVPGATWRTYGSGNTAGPINIANRAGGIDQRISQTSQKAIYNWQTFDIGATSSVTFDMALKGASALNRVTGSAAPSQIFGRLAATNSGEIYLINANGILFGRTAVVNTGSLIASTLDVTDDNFKGSLLPSMTATDTLNAVTFEYTGAPEDFVDKKNFVQVAPGATITTPSGGRVFLFAKNVENGGTIATPDGQTILAAGSQAFLRLPDTRAIYGAESNPALPVLRGLLVEMGDKFKDDTTLPAGAHLGTVTNQAGATISVPRGNATLVGMAVNQMGHVSATTSVSENGTIFLRAQGDAQLLQTAGSVAFVPAAGGTLTLGPGSMTDILPDPTPSGATPATTTDNAGFLPSRMDLLGKTVEMQYSADVVAPGATVNLRAESAPAFDFGLQLQPDPDARVVLRTGSRIDVSGTTDAAAGVDRFFVRTDLLTSSDLADAPLQKDGILYRSQVTLDVRGGSRILGNLARYDDAIGRTVDERLSAGGTVDMVAQGAVMLAPGSVVDVSGGQMRFTPAMVNETQLVSTSGAFYTMNDAPADLAYLYGVNLGKGSLTQYDRWGAIPTPGLTTPAHLEAGYVQGKDAGTLFLDAPILVMQGTLAAATVTGERQHMGLDPLAAPGRLPIGDAAGFDKFDKAPLGGQPTLLTSFLVDAQGPALSAGAWQNPLESTLEASGVALSTITRAGFGDVSISAQGDVNFAAGADLVLADHASLALESAAGNIALGGHLIAHDGAVTMTAERGHVGLGAGSTIDLSGRWINQMADAGPEDASAIAGGSFVAQGERGVTTGGDSLVDVSGGATVTAGGALEGGNAGSITLRAGRTDALATDADPVALRRLELGGSLRGIALEGSTGGSLALRAPSVRIGNYEAGTPGASFHLDPAFFTQGGFSSYAIDGLNFLDVSTGTQLAPTRASWYAASADYRYAPTGSDPRAVLALGASALSAPAPVSLSLASSGIANDANLQGGGSLQVDAGSEIRLVPGSGFTGTGAVKVRVDGSIVDHGGNVSLSTPAAGGLDVASYVWLGSGASIDVSGTTVVTPSTDGLVHGQVQDGGNVTLSASGVNAASNTLGTSIVLQEGSRIDLDGTTGTVSVVERSAAGTVTVPEAFETHGGSLVITGSSDLRLEGSVSAHGGSARAAGGSITVNLMGATDDFSGFGSPFATLPTLRIVDGLSHGTATLTPSDLPTPREIAVANDAGPSHAQVSAQWIRDSGATDLTLAAPRRLYVSGDVDLQVARNLTLDTQALVVDDGRHVVLGGATTIVGNTHAHPDPNNGQVAPPPVVARGTGDLAIQGADLVVDGNLVTQNVGTLTLGATHDLQLRASLSADNGAGTLATTADVNLRAAQVYPATGQQYTFSAPGQHVTVSGGDASAPKPLSAGGSLTIAAGSISQDGVVRAPFGTISLDATDRLALGAGSETSVSGAGLTVAYGTTSEGARSWVSPTSVNGENAVVTALPGKRLSLASASLATDAGAKVDLSGGGTVVAYEFIAGPGGSTDVFAGGDGSYAIVAGMQGLAPYDPAFAGGAAPTGEQIVIGTGAPVPAGTYTLLPARYALQPGAFLVTPAGGAPLHEGAVIRQADGTVLVGARMASANTTFESTSSQSWHLQTSAQARKHSEVLTTSADTYFPALARSSDLAAPRGASDGGVLQVAAGSASIEGQFDFHGARDTAGRPAGLGGIAAFSADHIVVGGDATPPADDTLTLSVRQLDAMAASTLLLGATVGAAGVQGTTLEVIAQDVTFLDAGTTLRGDDIVVAATGGVSVRGGARIVANAPSATTDAPTAFEIAGDGAALRVANTADAAMTRSGSTGAAGTMWVGPGASLDAGAGTLIVDGTRANHLSTDATLHAANITLAANSVRVGNTPTTAALVLDDTLLGQVDNASHLTLRGYDGISFLADTRLGGHALAAVTLDAPSLTSAKGSATVEAGEIALANTSGPAHAPAPAGDGALTLHADASHGTGRILLDDGHVAIGGTQALLLDADRALVLNGSSALRTGGDLVVQAPVVIAQKPASGKTSVADATLTAAGSVRFVGGGTADAAAPAVGGALAVEAASIEQGTAIALPSGDVRFTASTGDVRFAAGSSTNLAGTTRTIDGTPVSTGGGSFTAQATAGAVDVAAGAAIDVSAAGDARGGSASFLAPQGTIALAGSLRGTAAQPANGAGLLLDAQAVPSLAEVAAIQSQAPGNFGGALDVRQRGAGTLALEAGTTLTAPSVTLENDGGALTVAGRIDASGAQGGHIALAARDDLTLEGGAGLSVHARGANAPGGRIELTTSTGTLALRSGASLDLASDAGAANPDIPGGRLTLRAPRTGIDALNPGGTDVGIAAIGAKVTGASTVDVQAVQVYEGVSRITNDWTDADPAALQIYTMESNDQQFFAWDGSRADTVAQRIAGSDAALLAALRIHPESEIRSSGALAVTTVMDYSDDWVLQPYSTTYSYISQHAGDASVTLRAAGDITLPRTISAGFEAAPGSLYERLVYSTSEHAGDIRIVAGADMAAADAMRTGPQAHDLTIGRDDQKFQSNGDFNTVALRSTTGNVSLAASGDIDMRERGSHVLVYTTGRDVADDEAANVRFSALPGVGSYAFEVGAGDVTLNAGGSILANAFWHNGGTSKTQDFLNLRSPFTTFYAYLPDGTQQTGDLWYLNMEAFVDSYGDDNVQNGLFSLGGGRISVAAGGDLVNVQAMSPSSGYVVRDEAGLPTRTRIFAGGDVSLKAGRDIVNGTFESGGATLDAHAGRDFAWRDGDTAYIEQAGPHMVIENGRIDATARRDLTFGYVEDAFGTQNQLLTTLTPDATATVQAAGGNVAMRLGHESSNDTNPPLVVVPGQVAVTAPWGDLAIGNDSEFGAAGLLQAPVAHARFDLLAGGDITYPAPSVEMTFANSVDTAKGPQLFQDIGYTGITTTPLDQSDRTPVHIAAADGDVTLGVFHSARPVRIAAGADVTLLGAASITHQAAPGDGTAGGVETSSIQAGRDIVLASDARSGAATGPIDISGPGELVLLAGRDVDLGRGLPGEAPQWQSGIIASGNTNNTLLPAESANITVVAGLRADGSDYLQATRMGFAVLGATGLTDHAGDLFAQLSANAGKGAGTTLVPLGSADAKAFDALAVDAQLARVQALVGQGFYDAHLAAYVRSQPGQSGLSDAQALAAFSGLSASRQAAAPGAILAQSFATQAPPVREGFVTELAAASATAYPVALLSYMHRQTGRDFTLPEAITAFEALPLAQQVPLMDAVLVSEVRVDGRAAAAATGDAQQQAYDRGYRTIATLFPVDRPDGDIDMPEATVRTLQSSSITMLAPGGGVDGGGLGASTISPNHLGVVTVGGGDISAIVRDDFLVNQSRVFTLAQGDVLAWSSEGNIDAGRGAKTIVGAPAPVLRFDQNTGRLYLDTSGSFTGSGIAVLDAGSTLDLYAPAGAINAGEAGIKSAGDAFFAAQTFIGTDNLSVGGKSVGAPPPVQGGGTAVLANAGNSLLANASAVADDQKEERRKRRMRRNLLIEFLGFGPPNS